jgi:hypothetical protein
VREALVGLDADQRGDVRGFETTPGIADRLLHGGYVEAAAHLVRARDGEVFAGGREDAALLELFLERFHLGFVDLKREIGVADRVGESFVGEIVESITVVDSSSHGSFPWFGSELSGK